MIARIVQRCQIKMILYYDHEIYQLNDTNNEAVLPFVFGKIQVNACECETFT